MRRKSTKEILAESFVELAEKRPINRITITNITDNCGMSQPTFYNHFRDKYDLIVWIYVNSAKLITGKIGRDGYEWRDTLLEGARSYVENRDFAVNALLHTSGKEAFFFQVQQANIELLSKEVRKKLKTDEIPEDLMGLIRVYCYGTVQFTFEWLTGDVRISPEEVADICERSLPEQLKPYLYPGKEKK